MSVRYFSIADDCYFLPRLWRELLYKRIADLFGMLNVSHMMKTFSDFSLMYRSSLYTFYECMSVLYYYLLISWEICCDIDLKIVIDRGDSV